MLRWMPVLCLLYVLLGALPLCAATPTATRLGFTLEALSADDLKSIQDALGKRAGVLVDAVADDSPAAKAGCKVGEVILAVGDVLVDSPDAFEKALAGKTGTLELVGFTLDNEEAKVQKHKLVLPEKATPAPVPDEATKAKLKALDDAHAAGILNDEEYAAKKAQLLKEKPAPPVERKNDTARKGQVYKHPVGFTFWYPDGWTLKEVDDALQLTPPNAGVQNGQPTEVYFITGQPLAGTGITKVDDPQVIAFLDALIAQKVSPLLKRAQAPAALPTTQGPGMYMEWELKADKGAVLARTYACILKEFGIVFGAVGVKEKITARDTELKAIFASFGVEAAKQDPAVVGAWQLFTTRTLRNEDNVNFTTDDPRRASSVSDEQTTLQLAPDGTAVRTSVYRMIAGGGAAGSGGKVWLDTGDQRETKKGRWYAGNDTLCILWDNGSMDSWKYGVVKGDAPTLKLLTGATVQFWSKR
jgi:hypothetical protein